MLRKISAFILFLLLSASLLSGCIQQEAESETSSPKETELDRKFTLTDNATLFNLIVNETVLLERQVKHTPDGHWRSGVSAVNEWRLLRASLDGFWQLQIQEQSTQLPPLFEEDLPLSHENEISPGEYLIVMESVNTTTEFVFSSGDAHLKILQSVPVSTTFFTSWDDRWDSEVRLHTPFFGHHSGSTEIPVEQEAETMIQTFAQKRWLETPHCTREGILDIGERLFVSADEDMDIAINVTDPYGNPLVILHTLHLPDDTIQPGCRVDRP